MRWSWTAIVLAVDRLVFVTARSDVVATFCSPCVSGVVLTGIVVGVLVVAVHDLWVYARIIVVIIIVVTTATLGPLGLRTNRRRREQEFSLRAVQCKKVCTGRNSI